MPPTPPTTFEGLVEVFINIITSMVYFVFAVTFLFFVWQIIKTWVIGGGDEASIQNGKQVLVATIIGLVVMSGIWGILQLIDAGIFGP
jgi:hypothetical protein